MSAPTAETADVGDLTDVTVDSCAVVVMDPQDVIDNANIRPGLAIVGLASAGQANYESFENSGIGGNGLTSAGTICSTATISKNTRNLRSGYRQILPLLQSYSMNDSPRSSLTVGEALMSPTAPMPQIIEQLLEEDRPAIGMVHCSGGGQTSYHADNGIHIIKDAS